MAGRAMEAMERLRRSIAQRGLRNALGNVARRIVHRDLSTHEPAREYPAAPHPFDVEAGVDTSGMIHGSQLAVGHAHDVYNVAYYGTSPSLFRAAMEKWAGSPGVGAAGEYTFIDFGCGKGRAVMLAAEMGFRECVGVELNPALEEIARTNVARWAESGRSKSAMRTVCGDATGFAFPPGRCVVYLFNPFTGKVLGKLLDRMAKAFAGRRGELEIVYVNAEFREELLMRPGFEKLWEAPLTMSPEDAALDIAFTGDGTGKKLYGEFGTELCSAWRWVGDRG